MIWESLLSTGPRPRRELKKRVALFKHTVSVVLQGAPTMQQEFYTIFDEITSLAGKRNDVIHGIWFFYSGPPPVTFLDEKPDGTGAHYKVKVEDLLRLCERVTKLRNRLLAIQMSYLPYAPLFFPLHETQLLRDLIENNRPNPPSGPPRRPRYVSLVR